MASHSPDPFRQQQARSRTPAIRVLGRATAPHEDFYHWVFTRPWWQFIGLIATAFLSVNALFASLYALDHGSILNARAGSFEDAFFFSVQTMATIGYGNMAPGDRFAQILVTIEAVTGIVGVALVTGVTYGKFARPTARVLFSERFVLTPRDGVPHVMFRMANYRTNNQIVEAQLRVIVLVAETTREGEQIRRSIDLSLVRDRSAAFVLSWTAMHRVDENSPFFGADALARLRAQRAEIFLTLVGIDDTFAQTVTARFRYTLDDVVENARFADILTVGAEGERIIDYGRFHDVVALATPPSPAG